MAFNQFHFIQAFWLWGLLGIPLAILIYAKFSKVNSPSHLLERFADGHLLPHLIRKRSLPLNGIRRPLLFWALAWLCGVVAMAGPSWNYSDQQTFKTAENLVVILDLSQSMNAQDVKPSRVARARQEIQDLLDLSHGADIGLIAYAALPHMVTPLTDDVRTIKNLLPDLDTSLITIQGDRLQPALAMAAKMLKAEPSKSNSILVISDGAFQESDLAGLARTAGNAAIYTMGIGTSVTPANPGRRSQPGGETENETVPGLQRTRLQQLAEAGHGLYVEANYSDSDTRAILDRIDAAKGNAQITPTRVRLWEDRFYIPLLVLLVMVLPLFRRGAAFALAGILTMILFPATHAYAEASTAVELFLNKNQQADAAFGKRDYNGALAKFDTDYRRGVVAYRARRFKQAAAFFKSAVKQSNDIGALYNLGNAQLMQLQPEDAISSYEVVLKQRPGDVPAEHNLTIARKMLEQQQQKSNKDEKSGGKNEDGSGDQSRQQGKRGQGGQQNDQHSGTSDQSHPASSGMQQVQQQGKSGSMPPPASPGGQARSGPRSQENGGPAGGRAGSLANANGSPDGRSASADQRKQLDARADEWLTRLPNDPGSFLRNQFRIEEGQIGGGQ